VSKFKGINHVGVAGAGAWGTALAQAAARAGRRVTLWAREPEVSDMVNKSHENKAFLAGVSLAPEIVATSSLADLSPCDLLLLVSPAQHLRAAAGALAAHLQTHTPVLICAKGIERETGKLMTEVAAEAAPQLDFGMLSGPSFAIEVARGLPVAVTLAFKDGERAAQLAYALSGPSLRPYVSTDTIGVAVGGAVKNVLAIACGIVEGRGFGESARAALTARGFAEMIRFGVALGAKPETLSGLSGLGDLILTASSRQSRNFSLGIQLAHGGRSDAKSPLAEGADTADALLVRARAANVEMPIAEAVAAILRGAIDVDAAINALLARPLQSEV
jgi:glycerol-3-phosphate dehydrogenase (NAD(P)+)